MLFTQYAKKIINRSSYLDGNQALSAVCLQINPEFWQDPSFRDQFVAQLLQSIATVGDQLPDEYLSKSQREAKLCRARGRLKPTLLASPWKAYLLLRVEGAGHNIQKFLGFGLELVFRGGTC